MKWAWQDLSSLESFDRVLSDSFQKPFFIFKHSTRCSISKMALDRFERDWKPEYEEKVMPVYLDLLKFREISNEIANRLQVIHESPQVLLIKNGACIYNESHQAIRLDSVLEVLKN
jgi:bacillithiol system protein YtxJ